MPSKSTRTHENQSPKMTQSGSPKASIIPKVATWMLALGAALGFVLTFAYGDRFIYSMWSDRDLTRAIELFTTFQFAGAELYTGGRTPGGFFYYFLRLIFFFTDDPLAIHRIVLALNGVAMVALFFLVRRYSGPLAAAFAAAFFIASRALIIVQMELQNPSFTPAFALGIYWLMVGLLVEGKRGLLPWLVFLVLLTSQIHLSYLTVLLVVALGLVAFRIMPRPRDILGVLIAVIVAIGPYFIHEAITGFSGPEEFTRVYGTKLLQTWSEVGIEFFAHAVHTLFNFHTYDFTSLMQDPLRMFVVTGATGFFSVLFGAFTAVYLWDLLVKPVSHLPFNDKQRRLLAVMFLVLVLGTLVTIATGIPPTPRRVFFMIPAALVIGGFAMHYAIRWLLTEPVGMRGRLVSWVLIFFAMSTVIWHSVGLYARWVDQFPTYADNKKVIHGLASEFGYKRAELERNVVYIVKSEDGSWRVEPPHERSAYSFLLRKVDEMKSSERYDGCAAVLVAPGEISPMEAERALATLPSTSAALRVERLHKLEGLTLVGYRLPAGNCYQTFNNRYLPTAEEQRINASTHLLDGKNAVVLEEKSDAVDLLFRFGNELPIHALIRLHRSGGNFHAELHSQQLRGINMIARYTVTNPRLIVTTSDGQEQIVPFHSGTIGGPSVAITPWNTPRIALGPARYRVRFVTDEVTIPTGAGKSADVLLLDDLVIQSQ
jgi:hypothetical protein